MPNGQITLTRPLSVMDGVNDLFAKVLGGVRLPIMEPRDYAITLQGVQSEIRVLEREATTRFTFQNVGVANGPRLSYLRMAEAHLSMAIAGYPAMINISPLSWRSKATGLPLFGVLEVKNHPLIGKRDPNDSLFSIAVDVPGSSDSDTLVTFEPNIPEDMKQLYMPAATSMEEACVKNLGRGNSIFISTEFAGKMPIELETYLLDVMKKDVFESLWCIFQAPAWKIGYRVLVNKDPIIVGRFNHKSLGPLYSFLGIFDPARYEQTFAENYVRHTPQFLLKS